MEVKNMGELEKARDKSGGKIFSNCSIDIEGMGLDRRDIRLHIPEGEMIQFELEVDSIKGAPPTFAGPDGYVPRTRTYAPRDVQCEMERDDFAAAAEHVWRGGLFHVCAQEIGDDVWQVVCFCKA